VIPPFPPVEPDKLERAGRWLTQAASQVRDLGQQTRRTSANVLGGPQKWDGDASERWQVVVDARVADLDVTTNAFTTLGAALTRLASALRESKQFYDQELNRLRQAPPDHQESMTRPLYEAVDRAETAIRRAADEFDDVGDLADKITAVLGRSRMPGAPPGTDRNRASMDQLAFLFGSIAEDRLKGLRFQGRVLKDFHMLENRETLKEKGWTRGTKPDGLDTKKMVEVKKTPYQWRSRQLRHQMAAARRLGLYYRLVMPKNSRISDNLRTEMLRDPNANWYKYQGNGKYLSGKDGLVYQQAPDGTMQSVPGPTDRDDDSGSPPRPPTVTGPIGQPAPDGSTTPDGTTPFVPQPQLNPLGGIPGVEEIPLRPALRVPFP
jgi:hypothetical protein